MRFFFRCMGPVEAVRTGSSPPLVQNCMTTEKEKEKKNSQERNLTRIWRESKNSLQFRKERRRS